MDSLPTEVHSEIFIHLTLNERTGLRLVSRRFKGSIDRHLATLTHLSVIDEWDRRIYKGIESQVQKEYLSKAMTRVATKYTLNKRGKKCLDPDLICFLGKYCPNLSVLEAEHLYSSLEDLLPIASNLRYFSLLKCLFDKMETIMNKFDKLECFSLKKENENSYRASTLLVKKLLAEKRPILLVKNPLIRCIDEDTFTCITSNEIKSVIYDESPSHLHPLSQALTKSLLDLSISFIPKINFCQGPLPSLRYLQVNRKYDENALDSELYTDLFFTSPQLRCFNFSGKMSAKLLIRLFRHFHSLKHLKILNLELFGLGEEPELAMPQQLESFSFVSYENFELTNAFSHSLRSFAFERMKKIIFDFPKLEELKIRVTDDSLASDLADSLSKCKRLKSIELDLLLDNSALIKYSDVQSVVETLEQMFLLESIRICTLIEDSHEVPPLVLKQQNISSVTHLRWETEGQIQFHPTDTFDSLEIAKEIEFNGSNGICFAFRPANSITLHFEDEMSLLEKLEFECSSSNYKLLHETDWSKCPQLKSIDIRLGQSLTDVHINSLIQMMTKLKSLETALVRDWYMCEDEAKREMVELKQENIPSVKNFYWNVKGKLLFYPIDVFQSFNVTKNIGIFLKNQNENISFHFEKREFVSVILTEEMNQLNLLSIPSFKLIDRQFMDQMKYLKKVKRLYFSNRFWNTSRLKMILIRRFLLIRESICSRNQSN